MLLQKTRHMTHLPIKISLVGTIAAALVVGSASAALAEGTFASTVNQVQPTFTSRHWADNARDGAHTTVTLSKCKGNAGGGTPGTKKITSVGLQLVHTSKSTGTSKYSKTVTKACGTYDFGNPGAGTINYFVIKSINGYESADRKIFLNGSVTVNY